MGYHCFGQRWSITHFHHGRAGDGSYNYEAAAVLTLASSGGTYTLYLEASSNAVSYGVTAQRIVLLCIVGEPDRERQRRVLGHAERGPSYLGGGHHLGSAGVGCRSGMTLHAVATTSGWIIVYGDPVVPGSNQCLMLISLQHVHAFG